MKKIKILLSLCLIFISVFATAGDGYNKNENSISENSIIRLKIKKLLLAKDYNTEKIEGSYLILYSIDANQQMNITHINGKDENLKEEIYNHLQGKKLPTASPSDGRSIKVSFVNH
jgi:hypothetical protein